MHLTRVLFLALIPLVIDFADAQEYENSDVHGPPEFKKWGDSEAEHGYELKFPGGEREVYQGNRKGDQIEGTLTESDSNGEAIRIQSKSNLQDSSFQQDYYLRDQKGNMEWKGSSGLFHDGNAFRVEAKYCVKGLKTSSGECVRQKATMTEEQIRRQIASELKKNDAKNGKKSKSPFTTGDRVSDEWQD